MSKIWQAAEALASQINALEIPGVAAVVAYTPRATLNDQTMRVYVVPATLETATESRQHERVEYGFDVAVLKKLAAGSDQEVDGLMEVVQSIHEGLRLRALDAMPSLHWGGIRRDPIYIPDHLVDMRQFTSVTRVTYLDFEQK